VGDAYVFCSDGVFEARDSAGREFGVKRLLQTVKDHQRDSARDLVDAIFTAVQEFRGEAAPSDDMTTVAIRITA